MLTSSFLSFIRVSHQSSTSSYENVVQFLSDSQGQISFIGICESCLSQEHSLSLYSFPDYNFETKNQTSFHRGGIASLISNLLS